MAVQLLNNTLLKLASIPHGVSASGFNKYKSLFSAVSLFALFFIFSLCISYFMHNSTLRSSNYANAVQDMAKTFNEAYKSDRSDHKSLQQSIQQTIQLLKNGGEYTMPTGEKFTLPPLSEFLLSDADDAISTLSLLSENKNFGNINTELLNLSEQAVKKKDKKTMLMNSLTIVLGVMAIIFYLTIIVQLVFQLIRADSDESTSKEETAGILATVSEGLFLIGKNHEIGLEQSASLKEMFASERDLEGNFFEFIGQYVTKNDIEIAQDYIELLFGQRVKEKLIADLNPLTRVRIHIASRDGSYSNRYLCFKFKRVFHGEQLSHLLVSTTDITRQVLLEQELEETKEQQESQIDLLMSILHVDNKALSTFFETTLTALTEVNQTLKSQGHSDSDLRKKIASISRNIHKIKGDSGNLGLHKFENSMHSLEEEIDTLKRNPKVNGKDLLELTIQLKNAFVELEGMKCLVAKVGGIKLSPSPSLTPEDDQPATETNATLPPLNNEHSLMFLTQQIAQREGKRVMYMEYGMNDSIPEALSETVHDIAIQLVRNSIVHGVELPDQRIAHGKSSVGQVIASFNTLDNGGYEIVVQDDGAGLDLQKIAARAIALNLISEDEITDDTSPMHIIRLMFLPGFSSREEANLDAGRGVGLDLVKTLADKHQARISIGYKEGKYCVFKIKFPAVAQHLAA